ncbi:MAG: hypothetical protein AB7I18_01575 [Candidatus Berkiella sp.]
MVKHINYEGYEIRSEPNPIGEPGKTKFSPHGTVSITMGGKLIEVSEDGLGIPAEEWECNTDLIADEVFIKYAKKRIDTAQDPLEEDSSS